MCSHLIASPFNVDKFWKPLGLEGALEDHPGIIPDVREVEDKRLDVILMCLFCW